MNFKLVLMVIAVGAVMFFGGRSSLFQETFLAQPNLVKEFPLGTAMDQGGSSGVSASAAVKKGNTVPAVSYCSFSTEQKPSHAGCVIIKSEF